MLGSHTGGRDFHESGPVLTEVDETAMVVKETISKALQRYPLLGALGHWVWRLFQARYTAGAVGVIFNDQGQLLLLKHVYRPRLLWGLPGGYVAHRENPADTVVRELLEETGLTVEVVAPLMVEHGSVANHLDLAYLCRLKQDGEVLLSSEILAYRWAALDDLPSMRRFHYEAIQRAMRVREVSEWR